MWKLFVVMAGILLFPGLAEAHKLNVFASQKGDEITGYGYFKGNVRAQNIDVLLLNEAEEILQTTKTNEKGEFRFVVKGGGPFIVLVKTIDGHQGRWVLGARSKITTKTAPQTAATSVQVDQSEVLHQLQDLKEQLAGYEEKTRLHDVLGGIGYIVGLFGLAYGVAARRKGI